MEHLTVKIDSDCKADKYGKRYLKTKTAVICKFPDGTSGFSFHGKERLAGWTSSWESIPFGPN
jgi:hypothetical protein